MRWRRRPSRRRGGRCADFLAASKSRAKPIFVRVNPLDGGLTDEDLDAVLPGHPDGIVLPKAEGGESVAELTRRLTARGNATTVILRDRDRDAGGDVPARHLWRPAAADRPDLGGGGPAGGDRRGDQPRGGRALHAALRARPLALPVRRGGGGGAADRDGLSGVQGSWTGWPPMRRGRGATASPA